MQRFHDKKDVLFDLVEGLESFNAKSKYYVTRYLDAFFEITSQPQSVKAKLIDKCNAAESN